MSKKSKIDKVQDNMDKHQTYLKLNKTRQTLFESKNYLSVISLSYSMIEDRLLSILHYMYIIDRNIYPYKIEEKVKPSIKVLMDSNNKKTEDYIPHIENINTKIKIIKKIYNYKKNDTLILEMKRHLEKTIDINDLKKQINKLNDWIKYRNEITHSIYNKNLDDLSKKEKMIAQDGILLANNFDKFSDLLKGRINNKKSFREKMENNLFFVKA